MFKKLLAGFAFALLLGGAAQAQTLVLDQIPAPSPSASVQTSGNSEVYMQSYAVSGGTIYQTFYKPPGPQAATPLGQSFVPSASSPLQRYLSLTDAKADTGVPITATATGGAVGVSRTAGTSLDLVGEATSSNAKTDKAVFQTTIPNTYVAGASIPVTVNANYTGTGTVTGASCSITLAAYSEVNGVETALTVSAAQLITGTASNLAFTVTGTVLVPGESIVLEPVMLITSSSGANTGQINAVSLTY